MDHIRRLLTADWYFRKQKKWPLIDMFTLDTLDDYSMTDDFPLLPLLLHKYPRNLAACGGAVLRLARESNLLPHNRDVDIFFYGCDEQEATAILEDCVATLVEKFPNVQVRVEHRMHITNVALRWQGEHQWESRVYQFVHRIYPTLDSIIGGFDIQLCMIALVSENKQLVVKSTPIGFYCIASKEIIIDTTRRSTSYEYRIMKYVYRHHATVIFPGLDMEKLKVREKEMYADVSMRRRASKIEEMLHNMGLVLVDGCKIEDMIKWKSEDHVAYYTSCDDEEDINNQHEECDSGKPCNCDLEPMFSYGMTNMKITDGDVGPRYDKITRMTPDVLTRYSDYSDSKILDSDISAANGSMLRCGNLAGVFVSHSYERDEGRTHASVLRDFRQMCENPNILFDADEYASYYLTSRQHYTVRGKIGRLAEFALDENGKLINPLDTVKLYNIIDIMKERMKTNAKICREQLQGVKWITENPGRQWTSSINPIMEDPRKFYGEMYESFTIGIPSEIESTLRLMRLRPGIWRSLPRDVFKLLLTYVLQDYM